MKDNIVKWIRDYFAVNGPNSKAIVGISGGKDSSIVAALCVEALGKDRVIGVLMPQTVQKDINFSRYLVDFLGIQSFTINIGSTVDVLQAEIAKNLTLTEQANINMPARIRMTTLYAVAQCVGGRVANTCNKSEDWVGYATKYGDGAGDFSPLANYTVKEVLQIGEELGLPKELIYKTPIDGLCGKTDEDNLGFTYATLDEYIINGNILTKELKENIDHKHKMNVHKLRPMPTCENSNKHFLN